jgi:hypothetical protein
VIPGQGDQHKPGFDPHSVPFHHTQLEEFRRTAAEPVHVPVKFSYEDVRGIRDRGEAQGRRAFNPEAKRSRYLWFSDVGVIWGGPRVVVILKFARLAPVALSFCMLSFSGSRGMSSMFWLLQFYRVNPDGTRTGGDIVNDPSSSVELASAQAQSMMQNITFPWGRANLCLIKSQYGASFAKRSPMPTGLKGEKRPRDPNQLAKLIVDIATGQVEDRSAQLAVDTKVE